MAVQLRKSWMIAGALAVSLAAVLGWAWTDGGIGPLSPQVTPAALPQVGP